MPTRSFHAAVPANAGCDRHGGPIHSVRDRDVAAYQDGWSRPRGVTADHLNGAIHGPTQTPAHLRAQQLRREDTFSDADSVDFEKQQIKMYVTSCR